MVVFKAVGPRERDRGYLHLSDTLIHGSALRQRGELIPCELSQTHLTLLGRLLGADETDLLLSRDRLGFDLTDQLSMTFKSVLELHNPMRLEKG